MIIILMVNIIFFKAGAPVRQAYSGSTVTQSTYSVLTPSPWLEGTSLWTQFWKYTYMGSCGMLLFDVQIGLDMSSIKKSTRSGYQL